MNEETFNLIRRMYEALAGSPLSESVTTSNALQIIPVLLDSMDIGSGASSDEENQDGITVPLGENVSMNNAIRRVLRIERANRAASLQRRVDTLLGANRRKRR